MQSLWTVELSQKSAMDFDDIIRHTFEHFGSRQADRYGKLIAQSFEELSTNGLAHPLAMARPELGSDILSLPIQRQGRKARHVVFFKQMPERSVKTIVVVRVLHESMDFSSHL
jgi:toxin ParE1/3/4